MTTMSYVNDDSDFLFDEYPNPRAILGNNSASNSSTSSGFTSDNVPTSEASLSPSAQYQHQLPHAVAPVKEEEPREDEAEQYSLPSYLSYSLLDVGVSFDPACEHEPSSAALSSMATPAVSTANTSTGYSSPTRPANTTSASSTAGSGSGEAFSGHSTDPTFHCDLPFTAESTKFARLLPQQHHHHHTTAQQQEYHEGILHHLDDPHASALPNNPQSALPSSSMGAFGPSLDWLAVERKLQEAAAMVAATPATTSIAPRAHPTTYPPQQAPSDGGFALALSGESSGKRSATQAARHSYHQHQQHSRLFSADAAPTPSSTSSVPTAVPTAVPAATAASDSAPQPPPPPGGKKKRVRGASTQRRRRRRKEPKRNEFTTMEEYQKEWQRWRRERDSNNISVQKSRDKQRQTVTLIRQERDLLQDKLNALALELKEARSMVIKLADPSATALLTYEEWTKVSEWKEHGASSDNSASSSTSQSPSMVSPSFVAPPASTSSFPVLPSL